jgi:hypothetical protein
MREPHEPNNMNQPKPNDDPQRPGDLPFGRQSSADDGWNLAADLQSTEAALSRLRPIASQIDRDRLMYRAGWAAAETAAAHKRRGSLPRLGWPVALGGMTAVAATLLGMLLARPEPGVVERVVYLERDTERISTDAARAFAQPSAGASAADGQELGVWTAAQWLRAAATGSSQLASDLLPAAGAGRPANTPLIEEPVVLTSRSLELLLNDDDRGSSKSALPDCQSPHALEPTHDL